MTKETQIELAKAALTSLVPVKKTKRDELIELILSQVGKTEEPGGKNKIFCNTWFYGREVFDGDKGPGYKYPWCCTFVCWSFDQIGKRLPRADYNNGWSSVPNLYEYAVNHNMLTDDPQPGDLVIYWWKDKHDLEKRIKHIGFFMNWELDEKKARTHLRNVEGNTSFDEAGSQDNGGAVALKRRNTTLVKSFINVSKFLQ